MPMAPPKPRGEYGDLDVEEAEAFLRAHGWTKVDKEEEPAPRKRWLDPQTGKAPERRVVREDRIDNQTRTIKQTFVTAPKWYYTLEEAVKIQTQRNNDGRDD